MYSNYCNNYELTMKTDDIVNHKSKKKNGFYVLDSFCIRNVNVIKMSKIELTGFAQFNRPKS